MQPGCHKSKVVRAGQHQISQMLLSAFPSFTMSHKPYQQIWPKYSKSNTQSLTELPRKSPLTRLIIIANNMMGHVNEYPTMHYFRKNSVNGSIYDFDWVFLESPVKNCIDEMLFRCPIESLWALWLCLPVHHRHIYQRMPPSGTVSVWISPLPSDSCP